MKKKWLIGLLYEIKKKHNVKRIKNNSILAIEKKGSSAPFLSFLSGKNSLGVWKNKNILKNTKVKKHWSRLL